MLWLWGSTLGVFLDEILLNRCYLILILNMLDVDSILYWLPFRRFHIWRHFVLLWDNFLLIIQRRSLSALHIGLGADLSNHRGEYIFFHMSILSSSTLLCFLPDLLLIRKFNGICNFNDSQVVLLLFILFLILELVLLCPVIFVT